MEGDIQFVADSFLIERTFQILAEAGEGPLRKYAFDLGSLLDILKGGIQSFVKQNIDTSSPGNTTNTVINLLAPAVFFRLHPVLGVLMTVGQLFDLDLGSIYQRIVSFITPTLQSGQQVTAAQVNEAARAALPSVSDALPESAEPVTANLLGSLYDLQKSGELEILLKKEAISKNESPLVRMFSFLGRRKGSSLLIGILSWFIKTILMSAGMLAVGGMAASVLGLHPTGTTGRTDQSGGQTGVSTVSGINIPAPTSAGARNFKPKPNDLWVENLNGEQPYQRIVDWAMESYPDLSQYQDIIVRTPSFWNVVSELINEWSPGHSQWVIPDPYKTRNEILALFIPDVYKTIQQQ
jgi:hypothetical protein